MLTLQSSDLNENQLAELALAIQNRWGAATFVKMHEIVVVDDDEDYPILSHGRTLADDFELGFGIIMERLEMQRAFRLERSGKSKFKLSRVEGVPIPEWLEEAAQAPPIPEGYMACPHCVLPDTIILGDNKPIIQYNIGDTALGRTGPSPVAKTFARHYKGEVIAIKASGMLPIITTPDHPILVRKARSSEVRPGEHYYCETSLFSDEGWVRSKDVVPKQLNKEGHYVVVPIIKGSLSERELDLCPFTKNVSSHSRAYKRTFPLNEETAWLLGLFVAEGSIARELRFSISRNALEIKTKIVEVARGLGRSTCVQQCQTSKWMLVTVCSRVLARAFACWCGLEPSNKKIPDFVLFHKDLGLLGAFLEGYETGAGCTRTNKGKSYRMNSTSSRTLALQLQLAYARLGIWASIFTQRRKQFGTISGRSLQHRYGVYYPVEPNSKRRPVRFLEDIVLTPVRSLAKQPYEGTVHNLQTGDGTYLASNAIVHNCGKLFNDELLLSMHTKLHYII